MYIETFVDFYSEQVVPVLEQAGVEITPVEFQEQLVFPKGTQVEQIGTTDLYSMQNGAQIEIVHGESATYAEIHKAVTHDSDDPLNDGLGPVGQFPGMSKSLNCPHCGSFNPNDCYYHS